MVNSTGIAKSATHPKLYGLDHLRTLAIALVFVFHYGRLFPHPKWIETIGKFGWTGVDLFFVLSGYLIASQLFVTIANQKNISLKEFFLKRFFRIIPAYLIVVAIYFCFPYVHEREALAPLWKYLTFTLNLGLDLRTQGTFSHAWSLCIEEQFYLLLPLILVSLVYFKAIKKGYWLLIALFLFGFATRYYAYNTFVLPHIEEENAWANWYRHIYYPTYCRLDGLLVGVSIAALLQFRPMIKDKLLQYGNMFLLLSLFILAGAYVLCIDEESFAATVFGFPLVSIGYGVMVLGAVSPNSFLYKFKLNITAFIATLSYALYLMHKFIIHITHDQFEKLNIAKDSTLMFFICIATTILAALAMNKMVEKPFLKWRNKIFKNS
jgi:peptidoglycan/LPS O-acetylase OafA/YrhL